MTTLEDTRANLDLARDLARLGRGRLAVIRGYRDVAPAASGLFAR